MKPHLLFVISLTASQLLAGQDTRTYNSMEIVYVDNSKLKGDGISPGQYHMLGQLTDAIADKGIRNVNFVFLECNGPETRIISDIKARQKFVDATLDDNYEAPPNFTIDTRNLLDHLESQEPFELTEAVNVYYFLQGGYFTDNLATNRGELAKFVNVLPRQMAAINADSAIPINIHFFLPAIIQQYTAEDVEAMLMAIKSFKANDSFYSKTNLYVEVAR